MAKLDVFGRNYFAEPKKKSFFKKIVKLGH